MFIFYVSQSEATQQNRPVIFTKIHSSRKKFARGEPSFLLARTLSHSNCVLRTSYSTTFAPVLAHPAHFKGPAQRARNEAPLPSAAGGPQKCENTPGRR